MCNNGDIFELLIRTNSSAGKLAFQYLASGTTQFVQQWYIS